MVLVTGGLTAHGRGPGTLYDPIKYVVSSMVVSSTFTFSGVL